MKNMAQSLVSIIVPCFNSGAFIRESITSALEQTYGELEVLVVDDGSTDRTRETVQSIRDPRVRYLPMPARQGNYFARNQGLAQAKGGFVALLDADDLWTKDKLSRQMEVFAGHPDVGLCMTDHLVFEDAGTRVFYKDSVNT